MALLMKVIIKMGKSKEKESSFGQMVHVMKDNGRIIKCMAKVSLNGWMEDPMMGNTIMIKNKGMGYLNGLMGEYMKVCGMTESKLQKQAKNLPHP